MKPVTYNHRWDVIIRKVGKAFNGYTGYCNYVFPRKYLTYAMTAQVASENQPEKLRDKLTITVNLPKEASVSGDGLFMIDLGMQFTKAVIVEVGQEYAEGTGVELDFGGGIVNTVYNRFAFVGSRRKVPILGNLTSGIQYIVSGNVSGARGVELSVHFMTPEELVISWEKTQFILSAAFFTTRRFKSDGYLDEDFCLYGLGFTDGQSDWD